MSEHVQQGRLRRLRRVARGTAVLAGMALFVVAPALATRAAAEGSLIATLLVHAAIYALAAASLGLTAKRRLPHAAACLCAGAYFTFLSALLLHWLLLGRPFDPRMVTESPLTALETVWRTVGWRLGIVGILTIAACAAAAGMLRAAALRIAPRPARATAAAALALTVLAVQTPTHSAMAALIRRVYAPEAQFLDTAGLRTESTESVFILQLESGNSLALTGKLTGDDRSYMPVMQEILGSDGVFFPEFWGNAVATTRAQETIICGTVNNLGDGYTERPEEIPVPCLPELLADSGYSTVFLSSFWNGEFFNLQKGMEDIGFQDVRHATMMRKEDPWHEWGYDDCTFYDRAFDYLEETYGKDRKLLVYLEVGMNHWPFEPLAGHEDVAPFPGAATQLEKYLNSAMAQDRCVAKFYERYRAFAPERSHLLVLPDHSFPMGVTRGISWTLDGAYVDNYLTTLGYVPPDARKGEFQTGVIDRRRRFAQTDLIPTIFELLNGEPYPNSFAFRLRKDAEEGEALYEDCHVFAQPYMGGATAVVRGERKHTYWHDGGILEFTDLAEDPMEREPVVTERGVTYDEFWHRHGCERYGG